MTCTESNALIQAYLDNELDTTTAIALLEHARTCEACHARLQEYAAVKNNIKEKLPTYRVPDALRSQTLSQFEPKRKTWRWSIRWVAPLATGLALGVLAAVMFMPRSSGDEMPTDDLVWNHIRALKSGHTIDVVSSDKHTVKPWFAGKTDFSPLVVDLSNDGFPLLGGRSEYLDGHDVATLVYTNGKHYFALYEWPMSDGTLHDGTSTFRGYHIDNFSVEAMQCSIVSDASPDEERRIQRSFLAAVSGAAKQ